MPIGKSGDGGTRRRLYARQICLVYLRGGEAGCFVSVVQSHFLSPFFPKVLLRLQSLQRLGVLRFGIEDALQRTHDVSSKVQENPHTRCSASTAASAPRRSNRWDRGFLCNRRHYGCYLCFFCCLISHRIGERTTAVSSYEVKRIARVFSLAIFLLLIA